MAKKPALPVHITGPARRDIAVILKRSIREFGEAASLRYEALMLQALTDIEADPERLGSRARPEILIEGARTYHLEFSRTKVSGKRVSDPRHFLLYRQFVEKIEILRILHDARDLDRHVSRHSPGAG